MASPLQTETESILVLAQLDRVLDVLKNECNFPDGRWSNLGLRLGLLKTTLDDIEKKYGLDPDRCLMECLSKWLNKADNVVSRGGPPTWGSLSTALRAIKEIEVADQLDERTGCTTNNALSLDEIPVQTSDDEKKKKAKGMKHYKSLSGKGRHFDMKYKIIIIGDSDVGKSSLMSCFAHDKFPTGTLQQSTVGAGYAIKYVEVDTKIIQVTIWDTAGQEKYNAMAPIFYRGAVGALVVYDITNRQSYEKVCTRWLEELQLYFINVVMLIGNKCDKEESRKVTTREAEIFAEEYKMEFIETSALNSTNIEAAFQIIITDIYDKDVNKEDNAGPVLPLRRRIKPQPSGVSLDLTSSESDVISLAPAEIQNFPRRHNRQCRCLGTRLF